MTAKTIKVKLFNVLGLRVSVSLVQKYRKNYLGNIFFCIFKKEYWSLEDLWVELLWTKFIKIDLEEGIL